MSTLLVTLYFAVFVLFCKNKLGFLSIKPLVFFGSISYSLYLVHQAVGFVIIHWLYQWSDNAWLNISIAFLVVLAISIALTFIVEKPMAARIKKRYKEGRAGNVASVPLENV